MHSLSTHRDLGLATAMMLIAGAFTTPTGAAAPADPNGSTVDLDAAATLIVHKYEQINTSGVKEKTGNEDPRAGCKPISDVEFTIIKLNVGLTTYDGWRTLADLKDDVVKTGAPKSDTVQETTTGANSLASFADAQTEVGAYFTNGTHAPDKAVPVKDSVVTLSMTNPQDATKWDYNIHVYPKSTLSGTNKWVMDRPTPGPGRDITYTITTSIPKVGHPSGARTKCYEATSCLGKRISKDALTPVVKTVEQNKATLTNGTDYTLVAAGDGDHNWATIQFTEGGRRKAPETRYNDNGDTKIEMTLVARFDTTVNFEGDLSNTVNLISNDSPDFTWDPNNPGTTTDIPNTPTIPVLSKYGKVILTETDTDNLVDKAKYNGARFQVYEYTKAASGTTLHDSDPNTQTINPLTISEEETFTIVDQDAVKINYLHANDYISGVKKDQLTSKDYYCLVETRAPKGYNLRADPLPFRALAEKTERKAAAEITVTDAPKSTGLHLPLIGANDAILLTVAGVLLVAGGTMVAYASKRHHVAKHWQPLAATDSH